MDQRTNEEGVAKVASLIKDIRIAMLVTMDDAGRPHSRPMATQQRPFDGELWFMTSHDSPKVAEIASNPRVNVAYMSTSTESYLSVNGDAEVLNDRDRIREFWNPFLRAWFAGPEDPSIRLIRIDVDEAEYWDTPGGKVASLLSMVKAAISGDTADMSGNNKTVHF
jgi:general stress protein 26